MPKRQYHVLICAVPGESAAETSFSPPFIRDVFPSRQVSNNALHASDPAQHLKRVVISGLVRRDVRIGAGAPVSKGKPGQGVLTQIVLVLVLALAVRVLTTRLRLQQRFFGWIWPSERGVGGSGRGALRCRCGCRGRSERGAHAGWLGVRGQRGQECVPNTITLGAEASIAVTQAIQIGRGVVGSVAVTRAIQIGRGVVDAGVSRSETRK